MKVLHFEMKKIVFLLLFTFILGDVDAQLQTTHSTDEYSLAAKTIRKKYESNAYKLSPSKCGHMGLRMWRNYKDDKYKYLMLQGVNHTANALDKLVENGLDQNSLNTYIQKKNKAYKAKSKKKQLRKKTLERFPNYRLIGVKILRHIARLDELGMKHSHHDDFVRILSNYDFERVFTDEEMIKAWGAQLANQVYWLHQLGLGDYRLQFMKAVEQTYPDHMDEYLSKQQFENKMYTLTHIIIAASGYYSQPVVSETYAPIVDYFRENAATIIEIAKEDVVIEVGLSLLLVDETYPEIDLIRAHVLSKVDAKKKMILSANGNSKFSQGEHRNIIAVLLLDWKGCSTIPRKEDVRELDNLLIKSLAFENELN